MRRLFKDRNARWYLGGQAFSLLGDSSLWLALGIWVKELTGSSGEAALVFLFFSLSFVFSPVAGTIVDRVRRRPLLIGTNAVTALVVLALFLVNGRGQVWLIYLVMFLYGVSYAFLGSAQSALLKTMLPDDLLGDANGTLQTIRETFRLITPLVGAGLFAIAGGHVVALVDAASFLVAIFALLNVRVDERRSPSSERRESWGQEVTAGARHIWHTRALRQVITGTGIALLVLGFFEALSFAIVAVGLHRPPTFLGVLMAAQGAGALVGGPTAAPLIRRTSPGRTVGFGIAIVAVGTVVVMFPNLPAVLVGIAAIGAGAPWAIVGFFTLIQLRTPDALQGRAFSAADTVLSMPQTLSIAAGAALVGVVDYRLLLAVVAAVLTLSALYLLTRSELRAPGEPLPAAAVAEAVGAPSVEAGTGPGEVA